MRAFLCTLLIAAGPLGLAGCERHDQSSPTPQTATSDGRLSFANVRDAALSAAPGDILKVELENKDGHAVYEFKILAESGRVLEVEVDAASGAVLKVEQD